MQPLNQHEQFEMEVLHVLNSKRLLDQLVFGGGTMLRLCYDMSRYSVDMDFYFRKQFDSGHYFRKLVETVEEKYTITDSESKFNTLLVELRSSQYPRRLKIEINKQKSYETFNRIIAYSPHSTHQVLVNVIPLDQMMNNKIAALLDRKEIRDAFDIEFLIRRGIEFPDNIHTTNKILAIIRRFTDNDFKVKLGSLLPPDTREYYKKNRFTFLENQLAQFVARQK